MGHKKESWLFWEKYIYPHFDLDIDHESITGILGLGWANRIKVKAYYKLGNISKVINDRTFSIGLTEFQNYEVFSDKFVFHARIINYIGNYPSIGVNYQNDIEYKQMKEHEALKQLRNEQRRKEEMPRLF